MKLDLVALSYVPKTPQENFFERQSSIMYGKMKTKEEKRFRSFFSGGNKGLSQEDYYMLKSNTSYKELEIYKLNADWDNPKPYVTVRLENYILKEYQDQTVVQSRYPGTRGLIFELEVKKNVTAYAVEDREEYHRWVEELRKYASNA